MNRNRRIRISLIVLLTVVLIFAGSTIRYYQPTSFLDGSFPFFKVAFLMMLIFCLYFLWLYFDARKEQKDNMEKIKEIQYLRHVENDLFSAYIDEAYLKNALKTVAEYVGAERAFFWTSSQNHRRKRRIWFSDESGNTIRSDVYKLFPGVSSLLQNQEALLNYDVPELCRKYVIDEEMIRRMGIQSLMAVMVRRQNGEIAGVLGACNLKKQWKDTLPLDRVSKAFSMTADFVEEHHYLVHIGQIDSLTGLLNRNSYQQDVKKAEEKEFQSVCCIYIDANGLHELNNYLGHEAGDEMLRAVASALQTSFSESDIYRIGGDEFVVLCWNQTQEAVYRASWKAEKSIRAQGYDVSMGIEWRDKNLNMKSIIHQAEENMQNAKKRYYQEHGMDRRKRDMNSQMDHILEEKKDMETLLSYLAPYFRGVLFVNLKKDTFRHLYLPQIFQGIVSESEESFRALAKSYTEKWVREEDRGILSEISDFQKLAVALKEGEHPEFTYRTIHGEKIRLRILKHLGYARKDRETVWIFSGEDQMLDIHERDDKI